MAIVVGPCDLSLMEVKSSLFVNYVFFLSIYYNKKVMVTVIMITTTKTMITMTTATTTMTATATTKTTKRKREDKLYNGSTALVKTIFVEIMSF